MKREGPLYSLFFALLVCVVCGFLLAVVSEGLRPRRELNEAVDKTKHILKVLGVKISARHMTPQEIQAVYERDVRTLVIDRQGNIVSGKSPEDITLGEDFLPFYVYQRGGETAYAFPVSGKGLWSTLYGFLALDADAVTIRGITFYQQGETPGLGAQVATTAFERKFKGKKIWDAQAGRRTGITLIKGKVQEQIPADKRDFYVDGITGATFTSQGVTSLLEKGLKNYEPYFAKIRQP